ncbi:hypothetical protein HMI48_10445 [Acidithiobacillus ferrooxidans]|uniref:hypothetical protein n=1 Tax=Acidithiobacillus ferrooxidans TaxID=920 RepID=UPI001C06E059|nr:hypothetical protein [Acidithiobacillus ferrooxidans]MBU2774281.1 hypothetical protein [Acidithiobacillus ferrooxidans]
MISHWLIILLTVIVLLPVTALGLVLVYSIGVFAWRGLKDRIQSEEKWWSQPPSLSREAIGGACKVVRRFLVDQAQ